MPTFLDEIPNKKFVPNVIVKLMDEYYSIRQPDSGLTIDSDKNGLLTSINLNPTSIDPFRASVTMSNNSFKLLDKNGVISALFAGSETFFQGELVEIWIGRCGVGMDFADYYKVPNTYVNKVSKQDSAYTFQSVEARDRLSTAAFQQKNKLKVNIVPATTIITLQDATTFPTSGFIKIDNEFISYTGKSGLNLTGCVRGELGSTPAAHDMATDVFLYNVVEDNPINILLKLLISSGGGGVYDTLGDGAGIDESLVDIDQMEQIRDEFFSDYTFKCVIGAIESLKKYIEDQITFPLGIRLRANNNSKLGLALIDREIFEIDSPLIDHDELTKNPTFDVDNTKIVNQVRINWDYDDGSGEYLQVSEFSDADSIALFGASKVTELSFKGIKESLGGEEIVDAIQLLFLSRFAYPRPIISVNTHISSSYLNLGDKTELFTTTLPSDTGELNFGTRLEVLQKAVNYQTGDVKFQLSFTSFSGVRQCYIAPSDTVTVVTSQRVVGIGAGRGDNYRAGWKMRLYSNSSRDHASTQVNEILSISGDTITFVDDWDVTLTPNDFKIMFADYDDVTEQQKKFCFISDGTDAFPDGKAFYQINFG